MPNKRNTSYTSKDKKDAKPKKFDKKTKKNFKEELKEELFQNKGRDSGKIEGSTTRYNNKASNYIPDEMLRNQIGHFSFNTTIGLPDMYPIEMSDGTLFGSTNLANILVFEHFTNIGVESELLGTNLPRSGLNAAALRLYNSWSADNGKTTKYLPEDIAMAIIMVGEVVSAVAHFQRAYGVAFTLNYRNRTYPKNILKAMGFNPDDFMQHLSDARLKFNSLITRASNIRMPYNIAWFDHCWELYSHIFYDKGSAMGQYFINKPVGFFKYYEDYSGEARNLVEARFEALQDNIGIMNYLLYLEDMIDRILSSSLFNYVFTDVVRNSQRAGSDILGFNYLPEIYTITPEFDETYMTQMHNASWGFFDLADYKISDDPLGLEIKSNLKVKGDATSLNRSRALTGAQLLDFPYTDSPDVDLIIDSLAYKSVVDLYYAEGPNANEWLLRAIPPHPIYNVKMNIIVSSSGGVMTDAMRDMPFVFDSSDSGELATMVGTLPFYETLDVRPILYEYVSLDYPKNQMGPLNYWTSISQKQLARVFDYYFLGLFDAYFPTNSKL